MITPKHNGGTVPSVGCVQMRTAPRMFTFESLDVHFQIARCRSPAERVAPIYQIDNDTSTYVPWNATIQI